MLLSVRESFLPNANELEPTEAAENVRKGLEVSEMDLAMAKKKSCLS